MISLLPISDQYWRSLPWLALAWGLLWLGGGQIFAAQPATATSEIPAELTAAARDYRIEIYGAFRQNRAEYDLRRKQAEALLAEWQARGALPDEAALLARWFDDARRAATSQQPQPAAPNWNSTAEVVPLPPRQQLVPHAGQTPLRALPQQRRRSIQQAQITTHSADIIRPRESNETRQLLEASPSIASLSLVLELPEPHRAEQAMHIDLPKDETAAPLQISSSKLALPAAKLNPTRSRAQRLGPRMTKKRNSTPRNSEHACAGTTRRGARCKPICTAKKN